MTNEELQKAFEAGYAAAKALYSMLEKEGIEVTEADIRRIVEEVIGELAENGQIGGLERTETWLIPEREYSLNPLGDGIWYVSPYLEDGAPPVYPDVVWFSVDGVDYRCERKYAEKDGEGTYYFGNLSMMDTNSADTGEPFFALQLNEEGSSYYVMFNTDANRTLGIYTQTETTTPISKRFMPEGFGGLPVIDFGTLETESENNFIAQVDPSLFKDYMCFVGKFTAGGDNGKSTVHMVFSCIDGMVWTGYIHTHPVFGNIKMFGIILVNGAVNTMQITMVPGTELSE